ncbi:hypothetical protein HBH56_100870 [Parastagonospora nodorum]|uniref:Uncharacterized protein n=1 Tax=Phaeosphaeria nodorum (strain SN15 / ATCC MYA-4574 / FGSC 10173) TaxID=321614 RepID=A0A7U2ICY9_PHANO|nr:hypothetical protein HBH56_100870 [Parastagonospora nodorum]QRD07556.1 hypothetical protein JI435_424590 [Parastagonospora nodorum SN15]KAH3930397.1 hypothetical protein HBH54_115190 [Parastagonospora nodorum]KAH4136194.1 hypothetical protein HBH45_135930 [Parastagonospora nodorum]KAH4158266.1 hypothetical protein HBH44_118910 [Parastagonospora nodorum]
MWISLNGAVKLDSKMSIRVGLCHVIATSRHELSNQHRERHTTNKISHQQLARARCSNPLPGFCAIYLGHYSFTDQDGLLMRIDSKPSRRVRLLP